MEHKTNVKFHKKKRNILTTAILAVVFMRLSVVLPCVRGSKLLGHELHEFHLESIIRCSVVGVSGDLIFCRCLDCFKFKFADLVECDGDGHTDSKQLIRKYPNRFVPGQFSGKLNDG